MVFTELHLSSKILTFLFNQIKDKTITYQRIFPFGMLPKPLKGNTQHLCYASKRNPIKIGNEEIDGWLIHYSSST